MHIKAYVLGLGLIWFLLHQPIQAKKEPLMSSKQVGGRLYNTPDTCIEL